MTLREEETLRRRSSFVNERATRQGGRAQAGRDKPRCATPARATLF